MKFPPPSIDDLINFFVHEKLTDLIKSWHLHSRNMSQNFRKFGSGDFELLPFFPSNDPTDKNVFGQFGWFSRVGSHIFNSNFGLYFNRQKKYKIQSKNIIICCEFDAKMHFEAQNIEQF